MPMDIIHQAQNELKSDEVQELISYRPHWIIRNGNSIFLLILFLLLVFTWFIKYPDVIKGSLKLTVIHENHYYGQMLASKAGLMKIKPGQKVLIWVDKYPSSEFGYLRGTIGYMSTAPTAGDSLLIKVDLPDGLNTNHNKTIVFRNNLGAQIEVIVDNRRLFDRILGQLRKIIKR
jgi:hypothetical protein